MDLLQKQELRELLSSGETRQLLDELQRIATYIGDTELLNTLLLQEANFSQYKKERQRGITSDEELDRTFNRINLTLLQLIDDLPDKYDPAKTSSSKKSKQGSILYHFPNPMQLGEEARCTIRIAFEAIILREDWTDMEDTSIQSIRISEVMTAELLDPGSAPNFEIRAFSSQEQFVDKDDFTEWLFFVKPLHPGRFPLLLRIGVIEIINERERRREIVLEETIDILAEVPAEQKQATPAFKAANYALALSQNVSDEAGSPPPELESTIDKMHSGRSVEDVFKGIKEEPKVPPAPAPQAAAKKRKRVIPWIAGLTTVLVLALFALPQLGIEFGENRGVEVTEEVRESDDVGVRDDEISIEKGQGETFSFAIILHEPGGVADTLTPFSGTLILQRSSGQQSEPIEVNQLGTVIAIQPAESTRGQQVRFYLNSTTHELVETRPQFILTDTIIALEVQKLAN